MNTSPDVKVGGIYRFDGVEFSRAYIIPKPWQRRLKTKVVRITATEFDLEMPDRISYMTPTGLKHTWILTIPIRVFTPEEQEYVDNLEDLDKVFGRYSYSSGDYYKAFEPGAEKTPYV